MSARRPLLVHESSDLSESSAAATPALPSLGFDARPMEGQSFYSEADVSPPASPAPVSQSQSGYSRFSEHFGDEDEDGDGVGVGGGAPPSHRRRASSGLGIATAGGSPSAAFSPSPYLPTRGFSKRSSSGTIPRVPVGYRSPSILKSPSIGSEPNTGDPLIGGFPRDGSAASTPDLRKERVMFSPSHEVIDEYEAYRGGGLHSTRSLGSFQSNDYQNYIQEDDRERLRRTNRMSASMRSAYEGNFKPTQECPTTRDFYISRFSFLSITIIVLCLFSTVWSGIFLGIAIRGPRWGRHITSHGPLKPADANTLTSIMAKLIELSFVTAFVAFLGQVLSRRAFMKQQGKGITLAEMSMWRWVVQPGTLITHWETARYAGVTILGILSLLSAIMATMYAPASTALVQPVLKFGSWENRMLTGEVKASFSNMNYVRQTCETPIRSDDKDNRGATCLQIRHAAEGYRNYNRYLAYWDTASKLRNGTTDQKHRPKGYAIMHENTTIAPSWINVINTKEVSKQNNRVINNVSLAMPHAAVFDAARNYRNDILQPEELDNMGIYSLKASVPSPVMHVLCANLNRSELRPIIYETWTNEAVNISSWMRQMNNATTTNKTVVDDIFGWTKKAENMIDYPPVFARYPMPFNTIMNHTNYGYGRDSIYLLGQGGKDESSDNTGRFMLCQLRVSITPFCSTQYNATGSGGTMSSICEDDDDSFSYIKTVSNATHVTRIPDWRDIGFDWANSLSLNTGIMDANASNSRLLTQLIMKKDENGEVDLRKDLPSPAEALAVLSAGTLVIGAAGSPFVPFWNYTSTILETPTIQSFRAALLAQQYASGGSDNASRAWTPVLLLVFLMNVFVLIYFLCHRGLVTDFSEPPNLFTLAVNSPPSQELAGSCGGGPEGRQFLVRWCVGAEGGHLFIEPGGGDGKAVVEGAGVGMGGLHAHGHEYHHGHAHAHSHAHPYNSQTPANGIKLTLASLTSWIPDLRSRFTSTRNTRSHAVPTNMDNGWSYKQQKQSTTSVAVPRHQDFELVETGGPEAARLSKVEKQFTDLAKRRSVL